MRVGGIIRWKSVGLGWLVAALVVVLISPLMRWLYDVLAGSTVTPGKLSSGLLSVALVSGFLAYLFGGFVTGRIAGVAGGLNGAMTAVIGVVVGVVLGALGVAASGGIWLAAMTNMSFGSAGVALSIVLVVFLADLFGGYIGGKLGEPPEPGIQRPRD